MNAIRKCYFIIVVTAVGVLPVPATRGQTFQPIDQLSVVDANGKAVGKLVDLYKGSAGTAIVALKANDFIFTVFIHRDTFETADLCFESADCSGPAVSCDCLDPPLIGAAAAVVSSPGNTLYAPAAGAAPRQVMLQSTRSADGTCQGLSGGFACDVALPIQPLIDLNTLFTPPFRLAAASATAAACCGDCSGDGAVTVDEILTSVNYALNGCPAP